MTLQIYFFRIKRVIFLISIYLLSINHPDWILYLPLCNISQKTQSQETFRKFLVRKESQGPQALTQDMPERNVSLQIQFCDLFFYNIAKANADQTSVRSHSPDIADDINREIAETGLRLANLAANSSHPDNTMTLESN